MEANVIVEPWF